MDYLKAFNRVNLIERYLADVIIQGRVLDRYYHRAWIRAHHFAAYLDAQARQNDLIVLKHDRYLQACGWWFCPKCYKAVEPDELWRVPLMGDMCRECTDALSQGEEAADHRPARQEAVIQ